MSTAICPHCGKTNDTSKFVPGEEVVCGICAGAIVVPPQAAPQPAWVEPLLIGLIGAGFAAFIFASAKVLQALFDEEYGGRTLPTSVRRDLIDEHIASNGYTCPGWGRGEHRVRKRDMVIDHIVSYANGGRTSVQNSQVLCASCNLAKGSRNSTLDYLRGL